MHFRCLFNFPRPDKHTLLAGRAVSMKSTFYYHYKNSFYFAFLGEGRYLLINQDTSLFGRAAVLNNFRNTN